MFRGFSLSSCHPLTITKQADNLYFVALNTRVYHCILLIILRLSGFSYAIYGVVKRYHGARRLGLLRSMRVGRLERRPVLAEGEPTQHPVTDTPSDS